MVDILPEEARVVAEFELRPFEDRAQTVASGHPVFVDRVVATLSPVGSNGKFAHEMEVTENILADWRVKQPALLRAYEAFVAGQEAPVEGTDLRNWPGVTPAQLKTLNSMGVRSVEDLATLSEEGISRGGMGMRTLQQKAKAYMESAEGNKVAEANAALTARVEALEAALAEKNERIQEMDAELEAATAPPETRKRGPGRPRKNPEPEQVDA